MSEDSTITSLQQPGTIIDPLTEIAREGARQMLMAALKAEAAGFVAPFDEERLADGRQRVVRHGHGPERTIQTGVGPAPAEGAGPCDGGSGRGEDPVHFGDPAEMGAADAEPRCAVDGSVPAWRVDR